MSEVVWKWFGSRSGGSRVFVVGLVVWRPCWGGGEVVEGEVMYNVYKSEINYGKE